MGGADYQSSAGIAAPNLRSITPWVEWRTRTRTSMYVCMYVCMYARTRLLSNLRTEPNRYCVDSFPLGPVWMVPLSHWFFQTWIGSSFCSGP